MFVQHNNDMPDLTKQQAKDAMQKGKKVAHLYFTEGEHVTQDGDSVVFEDGTRAHVWDFWKYREAPIFERNWRIIAD